MTRTLLPRLSVSVSVFLFLFLFPLLLPLVPFLGPSLAGSVSAASSEELPKAEPALATGLEDDDLKAEQTLPAAQRWYASVLRQQQIISQKIEEMRTRLHGNLLGTQEFLDQVSLLFERTDQLYRQWKKLGGPGGTKSDRAAGTAQRGEAAATSQSHTATTLQSGTSAGPPRRKDIAVGKSLNYLRLSLVNFFLGYCDSNGKQIDDAENQVRLSKLWRTRSLLFIKALDS